ncbi:MAG: deaminase, partial [Mucilaginibacter sp.]
SYNLQGCIIYTSFEPCPMCLGAIYWSHINVVYYGNTKSDAASIGFDDHFIYQELELPLEQRRLQITQLLRNEAQPAFKLWQISMSKTDY